MNTKRLLQFSVILILVMATTLSAVDTLASPLFANQGFNWARSMGGVDSDQPNNIAVDVNGNIYTIGTFQGTADFNPGPATANLTSAGDKDIFISKLNSNGNFVWAKQMGGISADHGFGIALDGTGNIYIAGDFQDIVDFDPGPGITSLVSVGDRDIFISKLDANGNFVWARSMGGLSYDIGQSIGIDGTGNILITGFFYSSKVDFDPDPNSTYYLTNAGYDDAFILKLNSNGNFVWAKSLGGIYEDLSLDVAVDGNGNIYTTGQFQGTTDFDPGTGIANLTSVGSGDIFISKLDANGDFVWAKSMGGISDDWGFGITLDNSGNVYTTGRFLNTADFDPGPGISNITSAGEEDVFISKLDSTGNFLWAGSLGGPYPDGIVDLDLAVDMNGNIYTIGDFSGPADFDPSSSTTYNLNGPENIFISKLSSTGRFIWAKSLGGTQGHGRAIVIQGNGSIVATGDFSGTADFDPDTGVMNMTSAGSNDIFLVTLKILPTFVDVPATHPYFNDIEILYANGYTGGCSISPLAFCPDKILDRAQAAVFMIRGANGATYSPHPTTFKFKDNWSKALYARSWAEAMRETGLTAGCQASPLLYCPMKQLTREEAMIFALKMKYGNNYQPPAATGTVFADMTNPNYWATRWAEKAYADGLIQACGQSNGKPKICPSTLVTRGLGAYMIVRAKNLTMP
jgi:hypothetical protein